MPVNSSVFDNLGHHDIYVVKLQLLLGCIILHAHRNEQLFLRINVIYINIHKGIHDKKQIKRITRIYYQ